MSAHAFDFKTKETISEYLLSGFSNPRLLLAVWFLLFLMTVVSSQLDMRSLVSAFVAWLGGMVTARLDHTFREERARKNNVRIF